MTTRTTDVAHVRDYAATLSTPKSISIAATSEPMWSVRQVVSAGAHPGNDETSPL
jgi:hypothetical protein